MKIRDEKYLAELRYARSRYPVVETTVQRRCTQCGAIYGNEVVELSRELVDAELTESHGYCPPCALRLQIALDAELAGIELDLS